MQNRWQLLLSDVFMTLLQAINMLPCHLSRHAPQEVKDDIFQITPHILFAICEHNVRQH